MILLLPFASLSSVLSSGSVMVLLEVPVSNKTAGTDAGLCPRMLSNSLKNFLRNHITPLISYHKLMHTWETYKRGWQQCRTKVKNLKKKYRQVKDHNGQTGRGRKTSSIV